MSIAFGSVVPVLRMFDVSATKRFYVAYRGCSVDRQSGEGMQLIDPSSDRLRFYQRPAST